MDNKNSITHYEDHEEDNINIQTEVLSDSIHCNTKESNDDNCVQDNNFLLICIDDINECTLEIDNTTLEEEENIKHYIEHNYNTYDTKREVKSDSVHCQTDDNNESRCVTQKLHDFLLVTMRSMNIIFTTRALS